MAAAALAVVGSRPAGAAFPGQNGKIVFSSNPNVLRQANANIYTINPDGTGQTRLTRGTKSDEFPSFSPNGKKIVFDRFVIGDFCSQIYVMDADGPD